MKKFCALLALLLCLCAMPQAAWAADKCRVLVENIEIGYVEVRDGCVFVPADLVFGVFDYDVKNSLSYYDLVDTDEEPVLDSSLTAHKEGGPTLTLNLGETTAYFGDGETWEMPAAPYVSTGGVVGFFCVPVRLLEQENFGCTVDWLPEKQLVQVKLKQRPAVVYPFAELTAEQLAGVEVHYGAGYELGYLSTLLNEEETAKMLDMLHNLAYYDMPIRGEILNVSGGMSYKFDLLFADGSRRGLGNINASDFSVYQFFDNLKDSFEETLLAGDYTTLVYPAVDEKLFDDFDDFYHELNYKYNPKYN